MRGKINRKINVLAKNTHDSVPTEIVDIFPDIGNNIRRYRYR